MASLVEIVEYLQRELKVDELPDYSGAMNGLQLECQGEVLKVCCAVDASLPVIEKATAKGADLLIVHHGLFWQGAQMLVGAQYKKIQLAMRSGMAIYSSHLPLDVHDKWGNNALLAGELGMEIKGKFMEWKGVSLGIKGALNMSRSDLQAAMINLLGERAHFCPGKESEDLGVVGIITGGAGSQVEEVSRLGVDTFITGEGPHWSYALAEELGVNLFYGGHYATEVFGVKELGRVIAAQYGVDWEFIDHPTGL